MLVLSREKTQRIIIKFGEIEVVVTVVGVGGKRARLGFDAPKEVTILREELEVSK